MNNHIIIGTGRRCLCGMFEGKPLGCADIIKSIETIKRHGQSWDGGLLARLMETLIVDVDKPQTRQGVLCSKDLLAAVVEIEWCVETLKQHRQHWMLTKSLNVLPSDGQCGILVKALERASEILKAANDGAETRH